MTLDAGGSSTKQSRSGPSGTITENMTTLSPRQTDSPTAASVAGTRNIGLPKTTSARQGESSMQNKKGSPSGLPVV